MFLDCDLGCLWRKYCFISSFGQWVGCGQLHHSDKEALQ